MGARATHRQRPGTRAEVSEVFVQRRNSCYGRSGIVTGYRHHIHRTQTAVLSQGIGERTYHCDECKNATRTVGVEFSMSVTLGTNLDVNYFATVDAEATNPVLNVQVPGQENLNAAIAGVLYSTTEDGRNIYKFTYTDVGPQNVGTTVNLSLSCDENTVHQKAHAVESYLTDLKTDADATVVAAADALLVYANAAKRVVTADSSIASKMA